MARRAHHRVFRGAGCGAQPLGRNLAHEKHSLHVVQLSYSSFKHDARKKTVMKKLSRVEAEGLEI